MTAPSWSTDHVGTTEGDQTPASPGQSPRPTHRTPDLAALEIQTARLLPSAPAVSPDQGGGRTPRIRAWSRPAMGPPGRKPRGAAPRPLTSPAKTLPVVLQSRHSRPGGLWRTSFLFTTQHD